MRRAIVLLAILFAVSPAMALLTLKASGRADQVMQIVAAELGASGPRWCRHDRWPELSSKQISVDFKNARAWDVCLHLSKLLGCRVYLRDGYLWVDSWLPADDPIPHVRVGEYDVVMLPDKVVPPGSAAKLAANFHVTVVAADISAARKLLGWAPSSVRVKTADGREYPLGWPVLRRAAREHSMAPFLWGEHVVAPTVWLEFPNDMLGSRELTLLGSLVVHPQEPVEVRFDPPKQGAKIEKDGVVFELVRYDGTTDNAVIAVRHKGRRAGYVRARWVGDGQYEEPLCRAKISEYGDGKLLRSVTTTLVEFKPKQHPAAIVVRYWPYSAKLDVVRVALKFTLSDIAPRPGGKRQKVQALTALEIAERKPWYMPQQGQQVGHLVTMRFVGQACHAVVEAVRQAGTDCIEARKVAQLTSQGQNVPAELAGLMRSVSVTVKNAPLVDVLDAIGKQAGVQFSVGGFGITAKTGTPGGIVPPIAAKLGPYRLALRPVDRRMAWAAVRGVLWLPYRYKNPVRVRFRDVKLLAGGRTYSAVTPPFDRPLGSRLMVPVHFSFVGSPPPGKATLKGIAEITETKPLEIVFEPPKVGATVKAGKLTACLKQWDSQAGRVVVELSGERPRLRGSAHCKIVGADGRTYTANVLEVQWTYMGMPGRYKNHAGSTAADHWRGGVRAKRIVVEMEAMKEAGRPKRYEFTVPVTVAKQ